jgi:uncharacterized protein YkwD
MNYRLLLAASLILAGGAVVGVAESSQAAPVVQTTSGACIQPADGNNYQLVLRRSNCNADNPVSNFRQLQNGVLQHVSSGKCIHPQGGSAQPGDNTPLVLWNFCGTDYPQLQFRSAQNNSLQQVSSGKCVHPMGGSPNPADGTPILLHSGCGEARLAFNLATSGGNSSSIEVRLLELTNQERMRVGLAPLRLAQSLNNAAQLHARDMDSANYFSHTGRDGSQPWDRTQRTGYPGRTIGENIAAGQTTPEQAIQGWMNSPGHRANILNPNFQEIGFGYSQNAGGMYRHYWVQVFGAR